MNNERIERVMVSYDQNMLRMLAKKRLDGVIGDGLVLGKMIREDEFLRSSLKICDTALVKLPLHFAAARSMPETDRIVRQFNRGLEIIRKSGRLERIRDRYR